MVDDTPNEERTIPPIRRGAYGMIELVPGNARDLCNDYLGLAG